VVRRVCEAKGLARAAVELESAQVPATLAHEDRLDHVIGHLVQNALDATAGGGSVTVRLRTEGSYVVLEVIDNGIGMSPEFVRDRLFKPFETTKPGGMGIGVYESTQYVAALGGRIEVDSTPGAGTRVRPAAARIGPGARVTGFVAGRCMNGTRRTLLIVEDDPALQKQMQWAFDSYETVVASDRESAIAQLRRYEPPVVTMDLGLPPRPDDPEEGLVAAGRDSLARTGYEGHRFDGPERSRECAPGDRAGSVRLLYQAV
jgi:anti-sigma regulatory factor (Ser/Thr protein kinase)